MKHSSSSTSRLIYVNILVVFVFSLNDEMEFHSIFYLQNVIIIVFVTASAGFYIPKYCFIFSVLFACVFL